MVNSCMLCWSIVNRGDWLWSSANIKEASKDGKIYVGRSTTLHNLLFCAHTLCMNYVTNTFRLRVRVLAGEFVLCSWARHLTLTVPLSTQVYKWVPASCWGNLTNCWEVTCDGLASCPGEVEILLASCYRNRDKHRQLWASLGSKASLHFLPSYHVETSRIAQLCLKRPQLQ